MHMFGSSCATAAAAPAHHHHHRYAQTHSKVCWMRCPQYRPRSPRKNRRKNCHTAKGVTVNTVLSWPENAMYGSKKAATRQLTMPMGPAMFQAALRICAEVGYFFSTVCSASARFVGLNSSFPEW